MTTEIFAAAAILAAILASARWTWWRKTVKGLPVLAYNRIGEPPAGSGARELWVSPEKFRIQISWLLAHGYSTLLFSDLLKARRHGKELPEKAVLITFEGAYKTTYTHAYPVLRELGVKGNIFTAFNFIGKADLWKDPGLEPWVDTATIEMLKEMRDSGLIEFGSLTMNHAVLTAIPAEDAAWEIAESKKQLETALGLEIRAFAYPGGAGASSPDIRAMARTAGYALDFGSGQGIAAWPHDGDEPFSRLFIKRRDTNLDLMLHLTRGASSLF